MALTTLALYGAARGAQGAIAPKTETVVTVSGRQSLSLGSRMGIGIALLLTTLTQMVRHG